MLMAEGAFMLKLKNSNDDGIIVDGSLLIFSHGDKDFTQYMGYH